MVTATCPGNSNRCSQSSEIGCLPAQGLGIQHSPTDLRGLLMPLMEVVWDLLIFLGLVAVGLVVLNLMARPR
jgi:hypothetical protein